MQFFKPHTEKKRFKSLTYNLIIKCMLPISIVGNKDFREYHKKITNDPNNYEMPCIK